MISSSSFCIAFFLSLLCSVSSVGAIIYIPPFIKFCFADHGSVLREKVHRLSSLSAVFYLYARQRSYAHLDRVIAAVLVPCLPCPLSRAHRLRLSPTARSFGSLSSQSPPPHILSAGYSVVLEKTSPHSSKGNHCLHDIKLTQQRKAKENLSFYPLFLNSLVFVIVMT